MPITMVSETRVHLQKLLWGRTCHHSSLFSFFFLFLWILVPVNFFSTAQSGRTRCLFASSPPLSLFLYPLPPQPVRTILLINITNVVLHLQKCIGITIPIPPPSTNLLWWNSRFLFIFKMHPAEAIQSDYLNRKLL